MVRAHSSHRRLYVETDVICPARRTARFCENQVVACCLTTVGKSYCFLTMFCLWIIDPRSSNLSIYLQFNGSVKHRLQTVASLSTFVVYTTHMEGKMFPHQWFQGSRRIFQFCCFSVISDSGSGLGVSESNTAAGYRWGTCVVFEMFFFFLSRTCAQVGGSGRINPAFYFKCWNRTLITIDFQFRINQLNYSSE